ncbi:MAG: RNA polymerase sigma factor [Myxococcales bacterium]
MTFSPAIAERFRQGDPEAFAALVRTFGPLVRSIVAKYFRGAFEREEAMQEVWLQAFRNRASVDPGRAAELPGWVGVLARHRCLDLLRRRPDDLTGPNPDAPTPSTPIEEEGFRQEPSQLAVAEAREVQQAVLRFESRLEPAWRGFFRLHFVEGLPYEDVAAQLGISRIRCKYLRKVLAARARRDVDLLSALGRARAGGDGHAP